MNLGVNIDHIAVLREARQINDPNPLDALGILKLCNCEQITIHLREDRRHIHDRDAQLIVENSPLPVNLECSINEDIIDIMCKLKPHRVTLVPENREEVTTEGGLDVIGLEEPLKKVIKKLYEHEIKVSLFVDPEEAIIKKCAELGVDMIELHTGLFANIYAMLYAGLEKTPHSIKALKLSRAELEKRLQDSIDALTYSAKLSYDLGVEVAAGHGLNYQNVELISNIPHIIELNIGQSIIARSVFTGLERAIKEMQERINA